jgi:hypothetical protein
MENCILQNLARAVACTNSVSPEATHSTGTQMNNKRTNNRNMRARPENRRRLFFEIRLRLLSVGVEFAVVGAETQVPSAYELYLRLFLEGSNINDFWKMYVRMKKCLHNHNHLISRLSRRDSLDKSARKTDEPARALLHLS